VNSIDPSSVVVVEPYALDPRRGGVTRGWTISRQPIPSSEGRSPVNRSASISNAEGRPETWVRSWASLVSSFTRARSEEYKRLSAQAMEIVRTKDSGTLQFDTYFNDNESECMIIERYRDSAAAIEHWENLRDLSETILEMVSVVHGEVLGEVSAELRTDLAEPCDF
jgi:quinol monooxygenase YgiN